MPAYVPTRITEMFDAIDNAATADAKGAALETLSKYLFETVPGVVCAGQNILDGVRAHELDLAFWTHPSALGFLDSILIVECKATETPVGSGAIGWFVRKLQDRGAHNAILIALNGITGDADGNTSAHSEIVNAQMREKIKILLLTRQEILAFNCTDDLVNQLRRKLLRLTLERAVHVEEEQGTDPDS